MQRREDGLQIAAQATERGGEDVARQALRSLREELALDIAAPRCGGGQLGGGGARVGHAQGLLRIAAAAVVGEHGVGDAGGFAVAGVVGRHSQELVALAGHAGEERSALGARDLPLPDLEIAAVLGDIDGDVPDAAGLVDRLPGQLEARVALRVAALGGDGQRRDRHIGIQAVDDRGAGDRRQGVEADAGGRRDDRARGGLAACADGVADESSRGLAVDSGRQQAALRIVQDLAGGGVDRLQQPGGDAALGIDAGAHPQHIALGGGEIEVALEDRPVGGDVDVDVAELDLAQAQAALVEVGVERRRQTDFADGGAGRVVELERVGQRAIARHVSRAVGRRKGLRALHAQGGIGISLRLCGLLQVGGELERLCTDGSEVGIQHADVPQVLLLGKGAGEHIETEEMRGLAGVPVVVGGIGGHRDRNLDLRAVAARAHFGVIDRCVRRVRVAGVPGGVAIPPLHLGKEAEQIGLGAVALAAFGEQDAAGERGVQAQHLRTGADGWRGALGPQQPRRLERGQPALDPWRLIRRQHGQRAGCRGVGQDGAAQLPGVGALFGDELVACERGDRREGVEAEGHRQGLFLREVDLGVGGEEPGGEALGDLVEAGCAFVEKTRCFPVGVKRVELVAQALEVVRDPLGQTGVGLDLEAGAGKAVRGEVEGIAGREVPTLGVDGAVERSPGHVGAHAGRGRGAIPLRRTIARDDRAIGSAADVGAEHDVGQAESLQQVRAVAQVGAADIEAQIGRVEVAQALQAEAVGGRIAGLDAARAADADRHVGGDAALDQVAVRLDDALAVRVGDDEVVQARRYMAQVEDGADVGGIQHLPAFGFDLELARARELDQRARREAGALDVHRDPAVLVVANAAPVGRDPGDRQRHQVGAQRDRNRRAALARAQQDVVVARLRAWHEHALVGRHRVAVGGIEDACRGHLVPADVDLVGTGRGRGIEPHPQGLACGDADLVEQGPVLAEDHRQRLGERERRHLHMQGGGGGRQVVGLARGQLEAGVGIGDLAFEDLVVDVRAHDDAPGAVLQRRQRRLEAGAVAAAAGQVADVRHLAERDVAEIPGVVGREVERVGPAAVGGVDRCVGDGELDLDLVADLGPGRHDDIGDDQIGRRRCFDAHRLCRRRGVVVVVAELQHLAARATAPDAGRVGHDEDVPGPFQVARRGETEAAGVAAPGRQAAAVLHVTEVAVLVEIQKAVPGQVDRVVPGALLRRRLAAEVLDPVGEPEVLAGDDAVGRGHRADLQVGRCGEPDRQRDLRHVVGLATELGHGVDAGLAQHRQAGAHGARKLVGDIPEDPGVGLEDEPEVAADRGRKRERGALGVALAGLQHPGPAIGIDEAHLPGAQQQFRFGPAVHQRGVAGVERGVAREVEAVEPLGDARGAVAAVGDGPGGGDGVAGAGLGLVEAEAVDLQVGLAKDDVERRLPWVAVAPVALEDRAGIEAVPGVGVVVAVRGRRCCDFVLPEAARVGGLSALVGDAGRQQVRVVPTVGDDVEVVPALGAGR